MKNAFTASRSSTTIRTLSIRLTDMLFRSSLVPPQPFFTIR